MGCVQNQEIINLSPLPTKTNTLKVFSLNFCGILKSPFEFFSSKSILLGQQLSSNFKQLLQDHFKELPLDKLSKMIGSIDKKTKDYRYSPLYNISAGIQANKFISEERFSELWRNSFGQSTDNISEQLLQFDILVFRCLLQHVYKTSSLKEAADRDPAAYLQLYSPLFSQSFLDKEGQISKLKESIDSSSFDVLFIQQASAKLIDCFKEDGRFFVSTSEDQDTMILANKGSFQELKDTNKLSKNLTDQEWKALNWNGHTSLMLVDDYILICGHLASKKAENQKNLKDLKETLPRLKAKFPDYEIICGCDCNAFVPQVSSQFNIYPAANDQFTTVKKRTWLQVQFSKADVVAQETKDQIFSTLSIISGEVLLINGAKATKQTYLPLDQHPYDHFLVKAEIQRQVQQSN